MKSTLLAACAAIGAVLPLPALAQHAPASAPLTAPAIEFEQWQLDNGLTVIAIPDGSTATVTTSLWYEVGSKLDPEDRSGFAHLFEHILSRKTANMPYNMINDLTADVGGTRNASTGSDRTNYYEIVPAEYLETMLWTHRERMAFPVVDEDVFETERSVVKEELRQRVLAPPYGRFSRLVLPENAYDVLPLRRPGIGSIEDLDAASLDDARAFHQTYYGPDTATLIVAGNFEMDRLRTLVDTYFADIPRRADPVDLTISAREPERTEPRSVAAFAPNVPLPLVGTLWKAVPATHPDAAALEVLDAIMGAGVNSRLYKALIDTGKAVQAEQFVSLSEEGGYIAHFGIINPSADAQEVADILASETARIRTEPVLAAELSEAKNELIAASLRQRETAQGRAFELGEALVSTGDPEAADKRLADIANVSVADVQRVAQTYLDPQKRTDLSYRQGEADPSTYANPVPMPTFRSLPEATGEPREVLPEGERQAPPPPGTAPQVASPEIVEQTLDNGLRVVAAQTGDVPLATMTVLVPGGSKSDPRAKAGIASLAASLVEKGTTNRSAEEIAAALESLGATFGGFASSDGTYFSLTAPVANMQAAGEILADVIRNPAYPEDELDLERQRQIDGLQVALKDPGALAAYVTQAVTYGDAPYGTLADGTPQSLAAITREDLVEHTRGWWHPAATQVIVSGGIAPGEAVSLTQSLFGDWTLAGEPRQPVADPAGEAGGPRTVVIDMPEAGQAAVVLANRTIARGDDDYYALLLANSVLGGGSSGRLFQEVRNKRGLSYGAYSSFPSRADAAFLEASAQTKNESADEVAQVLLDEFARLGREPLADDVLARRRLYLSGNYARSLESSSGFNGIVAGLLLQDIEPAEATRYAQRLQAVTPAQAAQAAGSYVSPDEATLVIVGDAAQFVDDLRAIRPDVLVIPADELDLANPLAALGG